MTIRLSEQIEAAIAAIDANPNPTIEELQASRAHLRELLLQQHDFAVDVEQARRTSQRAIPLWGCAGASSRHYRFLLAGRRRPTPGMAELSLVEARSA